MKTENPSDGMNDYLRALATFAKVRGLDRQAIFETLMDDIYFSHVFSDEMLRMGYLNALLDGMGHAEGCPNNPKSNDAKALMGLIEKAVIREAKLEYEVSGIAVTLGCHRAHIERTILDMMDREEDHGRLAQKCQILCAFARRSQLPKDVCAMINAIENEIRK